MIQTVPPIVRRLTQPTNLRSIVIKHRERLALLLQLLSDGLEIQIKPVMQELAHFSVLVIGSKRESPLGARSVDVDVGACQEESASLKKRKGWGISNPSARA